MKKLIAIAAVATCGAALAVESANIVGYAEGAATSGNKIMGAQFAAVAGSAIDLNDIVVTGYDKTEGTEAEVYMQSLDANGKGGMSYFFYDVPGELFGWLDGNDEPVENGVVTLAPGEGFWVCAPSASYSLQTAGQVPTSSYAVTLRAGNKMVVNSTPVAIDLNSIGVAGYDKTEGTEAEVYMQPLDANGKGGMSYFFYDVPGELFGWLDGNDEEVEPGTVSINPGEGMWVCSPNTSFQLELPGVTL